MKKKKIIFIIIILISILMIGLGSYLLYLSTYKKIVNKMVQTVFSSVSDTFFFEREYLNMDKYTYNSDITVTVNSPKENLSIINNENTRKKITAIYNMSNSKTNVSFQKDNINKKSLLKFTSEVNDKKYNGKVLVANATRYYYLDVYDKAYVNDGANNYFESINSTDRNNVVYIFNYLEKAIEKELASNNDDVIKTQAEEVINGTKKNCNKISISMNKKRLRAFLNKIITDLKADSRTNYVLSNYYKNFNNYKFTDNNLKIDNLIFNYYYTGLNPSIIKYELKITVNSDNYDIVYEYGDKENTGSIVFNNKVLYTFTDTKETKKRTIKFFDKTGADAGKLVISNDSNNYLIDLDITKEDGKLVINYSSKTSTVKKDVTYENEKKLYFSLLKDKDVTFEINVKSNILSTCDIDEDISKAVMMSSLSEEEKNKIDNYITNIIEYLEN